MRRKHSQQVHRTLTKLLPLASEIPHCHSVRWQRRIAGVHSKTHSTAVRKRTSSSHRIGSMPSSLRRPGNERPQTPRTRAPLALHNRARKLRADVSRLSLFLTGRTPKRPQQRRRRTTPSGKPGKRLAVARRSHSVRMAAPGLFVLDEPPGRPSFIGAHGRAY